LDVCQKVTSLSTAAPNFVQYHALLVLMQSVCPSSPVMSNPRPAGLMLPSRMFCATQCRFSL